MNNHDCVDCTFTFRAVRPAKFGNNQKDNNLFGKSWIIDWILTRKVLQKEYLIHCKQFTAQNS